MSVVWPGITELPLREAVSAIGKEVPKINIKSGTRLLGMRGGWVFQVICDANEVMPYTCIMITSGIRGTSYLAGPNALEA